MLRAIFLGFNFVFASDHHSASATAYQSAIYLRIIFHFVSWTPSFFHHFLHFIPKFLFHDWLVLSFIHLFVKSKVSVIKWIRKDKGRTGSVDFLSVF
ncbi:hypothetical protein A2W67_00005 [Candidatus Nomurabacteria bacterium RIFCSPLOWO2_02_40_28]|nr:MAG: hypothetical protein A2W50_03320 [Candidatus Nomurabacteria bacterium RIFCSPHIGHO2_02_40_30]OGI95820.1 MAG: hypothetical protein A2W67_00005 [Candidatus Nomurabacteria bacterium RIFCSPLOWO2_02_40_28]OGI98412.1 MAG: hypothetical protein A2W78_03645 [Candidatus Nomurabacteria bacterium RIFCSPLOWO2_12_40_14]